MEIYFSEIGLISYLKELQKKIRKENVNNNNSPFNISYAFLLTDKVFANQTLKATFWNQLHGNDSDRKGSVADSDFINKVDKIKIRDGIKSILESFLCEDDDKKKEFFDFLDGWVRFHNISILSSEEPVSTFQKESSISLIENHNNRHNNQHSIIGMKTKNIFQDLKNIFFIENTALNKMCFTRDMKDWTPIKSAMKNETDIIIVDSYLFQPYRDKFSINEASSFIDALSSEANETNIVIFYNYNEKVKNEVLDNLYQNKRNITFVGIKPIEVGKKKYANSVLHDRCVITNYRLICSGHSFPQYFKKSGSNEIGFTAHGSMFLTIGSIADKNNENVMKNVVGYLQKEILDKKEKYVLYDKLKLYKSNLLFFRS